MRVEDCYQLGYVTKTHGLKGEIQVYLDADEPKAYNELESMFILRNNSLIPFFIDSLQINRDKALVKLDDIDSIEEAQPLVSSEIYLPLSFLPKLGNGQYYYHEIIGFELFDQKNLVGLVTNVLTNSSQTLLAIDAKGVEVLVPLNDEVVKKVDLVEKKVLAELPDGLLEMYLENNPNENED